MKGARLSIEVDGEWKDVREVEPIRVVPDDGKWKIVGEVEWCESWQPWPTWADDRRRRARDALYASPLPAPPAPADPRRHRRARTIHDMRREELEAIGGLFGSLARNMLRDRCLQWCSTPASCILRGCGWGF